MQRLAIDVAPPSCLTLLFMKANLTGMRFVRPILLMAAAFLLAAYVFDCDAMATPEQAMQCCQSMPCSSETHHDQDCCKTMPTMHAPFVQPASAHGGGFSLELLAVLPAPVESIVVVLPIGSVATHCHTPPIPDFSSPTPLRI
jgi:hypothetical protein